MIAVLEQKRGFNYRRHTLFADKVLVETKSTSKIDKYEVRIEKLGFQTQYQADNTMPGKIFLVVCILIPVALTISELLLHNVGMRNLIVNYVCWLGLAIFSIFKQHQDDIYLVGGDKNLVFYRNIPSEQKVLEFIELVIKATKDNIKNKYLTFDPNTPDEEYIARLNWLKETDMITEEELENYKIDLEIKRLLS
ncbi:hypothetical protein [Segetibacter aerophilus]|uniref:Uncharacterized protein n=1 Tax=Segetibacter aerophilus TaxID=670293 RepID=A0A512BA31_9BACT|nr:hypothetical protein [Segetibacter aerophilus]GEO08812.1 hypothetical protein SAE01_13080 [Segetibacter aerophilus]